MDIWQTLDFRVLAITSAFFGAISNVSARVLLKDLDTKSISGLSFIIMGLVLLVLCPAFYAFIPSLTTVLLICLIAGIDAVGNHFYFKVFEKSEAGIATSILSLSPFFTFIASFLILRANTSIISILFAMGIMITIVLTTADFKDIRGFGRQTLIPAFIAAICFGVSSVPTKVLLSDAEVINAPTLYMYRAIIIGIISLIVARPNLSIIKKHELSLITIRGFIVIITWIVMYYALAKGDAGITATLANTAPVFTLILGRIFLKEKITIRKVIGIIMVVCLSILIMLS